MLAKSTLVVNYSPLVKKIAYHIKSRLPANIMLDDLIQMGMIGLLEAANNYNADKGASFETYASIRVRGAILDELRRSDWTPRSVYKNTKKLAKAVHELEQELGAAVTKQDIAEALGIKLQEYHQIIQDYALSRVNNINLRESEEDSPVGIDLMDDTDKIHKMDFKDKIQKAMQKLADKEKLILSLYYEEEFSLKEVGSFLGVSESRVSQIHSMAVQNLKALLQEKLD